MAVPFRVGLLNLSNSQNSMTGSEQLSEMLFVTSIFDNVFRKKIILFNGFHVLKSELKNEMIKAHPNRLSVVA